ncbi:MAG TPA: redoxin domain-containing protein [Polyangia bacterium]|nr:redoxin domain-containing protein [Polyangia bacterium]
MTVRDAHGQVTPVATLARAHKLTVVIFYAASCPCFAAHIERLRQLQAELGPRGVDFLVVDSERHGSREPTPPAEVAPGLPLLRDESGDLARRLGARYATESYVLDPTGKVRYQGGVDSDRKYLRPDAQPHLRQALLKLLSGDAPAFATSKALGCALRLM